MSGPITWRTVNGPSLAEASRPLAFAQRSIDNAFDGLSGVLRQQESTDQANWNQVRENNTQNFLNRLYSAQGADGFKALQDSGELDRMLAANGAQIDRAAVRSAMDGRLGTLQQRDRQGWEFQNAALDQQEAPVVNQVKGLLAQGNLEGAKPLIAGLSARGQATMLSALDQRERQLVERARGDTEFGWKGAEEAQKQAMRPLALAEAQGKVDNIPLQRDQLRAQINSSNASAAASRENVLNSQANRKRAEDEADAARRLKRLGAALDGNIYKEGVYKDSDTVELAKLMKDNSVGGKDEDAASGRARIISRLNEISKNGLPVSTRNPDGSTSTVNVPLPLGAVRAAILSARDPWGWSNLESTFEDNLRKAVQSTVSKPGADGRPVAANRAVDDYQNFLAIMRGTAEVAPVTSSRKK